MTAYSRRAIKSDTISALRQLYGENSPELRESHPFATNAQILRKTGVLTAMPIVQELGSADAYQDWTRRQQCAVTGCWDVNEQGELINQFHPVNMARVKPDYAGIPVIEEINQMMSQGGVFSVLKSYQPDKSVTQESVNQWLIRKAWSNLHAWSWQNMKAILGYQHWYEIPPAEFYRWADEHHIAYLIPKKYLTARQG